MVRNRPTHGAGCLPCRPSRWRQANPFVALAFLALLLLGERSALADEVALTFDDPHLEATPRLTAPARDQAIRDALAGARLHAALFVCGMRVDSAEGGALLKAWSEGGHLLGNHSWSHRWFAGQKIPAVDFAQEVDRVDTLIRALPGYIRLFRFPFLKEGASGERRDALRQILAQRGYGNGTVTIDASDWYVDQRLRERLAQDPKADVNPYRDFYVRHVLERATFYRGLAREVVGRPIRHTLLLHHNLLNAMFLGDVVHALKKDGWTLIDADKAYQDPIHTTLPDIAPAGESLVWALARQKGGIELRYPAEDGEYEKPAMDSLGL